MTVFDISVDINTAPVYSGDPNTRILKEKSMEKGDLYNLTSLFACLHTGTHIDAPAHFLADGDTIDKIDLSVFMGECTVINCIGREDLTGADIEELVPQNATRVIFKTLGDCRLTRSAVFSLVAAGVKLVGIDAQSVATDDDVVAVHRELALAGVVILEGLTLRHVQSGRYTLMATPLKIKSVEAAPCRALLLSQGK